MDEIKINNICQTKSYSLFNFLSEKLKNKFILSSSTLYFLDGKFFFKAIIDNDFKKIPITGVYIMIDTTNTHHYYYSTPIIINIRLYKDNLFTNNENLGYINNNYCKFNSYEEVLNELLKIYNYLINQNIEF